MASEYCLTSNESNWCTKYVLAYSSNFLVPTWGELDEHQRLQYYYGVITGYGKELDTQVPSFTASIPDQMLSMSPYCVLPLCNSTMFALFQLPVWNSSLEGFIDKVCAYTVKS